MTSIGSTPSKRRIASVTSPSRASPNARGWGSALRHVQRDHIPQDGFAHFQPRPYQAACQVDQSWRERVPGSSRYPLAHCSPQSSARPIGGGAQHYRCVDARTYPLRMALRVPSLAVGCHVAHKPLCGTRRWWHTCLSAISSLAWHEFTCATARARAKTLQVYHSASGACGKNRCPMRLVTREGSLSCCGTDGRRVQRTNVSVPAWLSPSVSCGALRCLGALVLRTLGMMWSMCARAHGARCGPAPDS